MQLHFAAGSRTVGNSDIGGPNAGDISRHRKFSFENKRSTGFVAREEVLVESAGGIRADAAGGQQLAVCIVQIKC